MAYGTQILITVASSLIASAGFWSFLTVFFNKKSAESKIILGLGHDRIVYLGLYYIDRNKNDGKGITQDEYENLHDYLFIPYKNLGGNGSAERVMEEVKKLPIHK